MYSVILSRRRYNVTFHLFRLAVIIHPDMRCLHDVFLIKVDIGRRESVMRGLSTFNQLIGNRTFLLLFVRTLEKQPDFSVRSRVRVASLLSVVLQTRMEYHTE